MQSFASTQTKRSTTVSRPARSSLSAAKRNCCSAFARWPAPGRLIGGQCQGLELSLLLCESLYCVVVAHEAAGREVGEEEERQSVVAVERRVIVALAPNWLWLIRVQLAYAYHSRSRPRYVKEHDGTITEEVTKL